MNITEKVAYVKGLAEGLEVDRNRPEGRILLAILDILGDLSNNISDLENCCEDISDQLDTVDEDLSVLENDFYEDEKIENEKDDVFYEVTCPTCNETVCISESIVLDGRMECPNCGEDLEFDLDDLPINSECNCATDNSECSCETCECEK